MLDDVTLETHSADFLLGNSPHELINCYGSPLYVYNEDVLRLRCREMRSLLQIENYRINYSAKANCNPSLLSIVREEGLDVDAMSPGEMHILLKAGFKPEQILFIGNNVSSEEMSFAVERGIAVSVDSISQLEAFGRMNPGGEVYLRLNPGIGAGHHDSVVTAGDKTKFGIEVSLIPLAKRIARDHGVRIVGINQHIGSLFLEDSHYLAAAEVLLALAQQFDDLSVIDLGGGFGVPYTPHEPRLDLRRMGARLGALLEDWMRKTGAKPIFRVEPGRYIMAECGMLLGTVHAVKDNHGVTYVGTDLGFNVLVRPTLYDAHHEIMVHHRQERQERPERVVNVVGNICETGDIIARERRMPMPDEGDVIGVMNAGAYGFSMSSNYNARLRPAEVLIASDGGCRLIRRRDTFDDLTRNFAV